jgi:hypothetical protein
MMQKINPGKSPLPLLSVVLLLAATVISVMAFPDTFSWDSMQNNENKDCVSTNGSSSGSCNNSSIALSSQQEINGSPVELSVGSGYYAAHPIAVSLGSGSRTVIANGNSVTSMSHEVSFAEVVSGNSGYSASASSRQGPFGSTRSASTAMQIDETVTSGRVNIGVLVGDDGPGRINHGGVDPMTSAWKNPAIEIEEEYVGTYHISKNFSLNNSQSLKRTMNGGFYCCDQDYLIRPSNLAFLSADDVFNSSAMKSMHYSNTTKLI